MYCKIADLFVEVPAVGGMSPRCREYLVQGTGPVDIRIDAERYTFGRYPELDDEATVYMESGKQFYLQLLSHSGLYLHASAVELDGKAYLFSGYSGVGKSTHTRLWQEIHGTRARVFNDDKPALRRLDGRWYAYGTPWCGKDGININCKVPLAGICFLKQAPSNYIHQTSGAEAIAMLLSQTTRKLKNPSRMALLLDHLDKLIREIPIYELENRPEPEAAILSYETMLRGAEEAGL